MRGRFETPSLDLHRVRNRLQARLVVLETRIASDQDAESTWTAFIHTLDLYMRLEDRIAAQTPETPLLTTKELADRLGITTRSLLARKRKGHIQPAVCHGKALRWRPDDAFR